MLKDLLRTQRVLVIAGGVFLFGAFVMIALSLVDNTEILGLNRWIKPFKFYISLTIFLWTIAVYLHYLPGYNRFSRFVAWLMVAIFVVEMIAVNGQAIRGTTSHFNVTTALDGLVFGLMGIAIAINTLLIALLLVLYCRTNTSLSPTMVWGMRLGLLLFLAGSIQGGYMSTQMAHSVGVVDGGPGLPLMGWSTVAGDLRVAHFLGLHSLQAIPLFALILERFRPSNSLALTIGFATLYFAFFLLLFVQALIGRPLIAV